MLQRQEKERREQERKARAQAFRAALASGGVASSDSEEEAISQNDAVKRGGSNRQGAGEESKRNNKRGGGEGEAKSNGKQEEETERGAGGHGEKQGEAGQSDSAKEWLALVRDAEAMEARRLLAFASLSVPKGTVASWGALEVCSLLLGEWLFAYKQHDLHLDHPSVHVTLQTQLCSSLPDLVDKRTVHGFRNVHQLDYATSGLLVFGLTKKAAGAAGRAFEKRLVSKWYLALVDGHVSWSQAVETRAIGVDQSDEKGFRMAVEVSC